MFLNSSFDGLKFGKDSDGNYGYIKDGADTVIPFKKSLKLILEKTSGQSNRGWQYSYYNNYFVDDSGKESLILSLTRDNFVIDRGNCGLITYVSRNDSTGYHTYKNNLSVPLIRNDGIIIPAGGTFSDVHDSSERV